MKIFVVNAGSSTLKYQVIDMTDESVVCKGICDRIGAADGSIGVIKHKTPDGREYVAEISSKESITFASLFVSA